MNLDVESIYIGFMIFLRCGAMMFMIPAFFGRAVPAQLRIALCAFVGYLVWPFVPSIGGLPMHFAGLVLVGMNEAMVGVLMGLMVRIAFTCIEFAGQIISTEIGLMISNNFNPLTQSNSTAVGTVLYFITIFVFFVTNVHQMVILAFVRGFELIPIGKLLLGLPSVDQLITTSSSIFVVGLQMAAPIIAVNFIVNLSFAVLGRAVPKMNVFMTSFAVRILAGLAILLATAELIVQYIYMQMGNAPGNMLKVLTF